MQQTPQSFETKPEDRVALSQKLLYSAATVAIIPGMQIIERIAQVVLNICLGINPTLIGVGIAIFRVWDAFTDPFVGNLSDIRFYPLDDKRCHEIRLQLEARRGELHGTEDV